MARVAAELDAANGTETLYNAGALYRLARAWVAAKETLKAAPTATLSLPKLGRLPTGHVDLARIVTVAEMHDLETVPPAPKKKKGWWPF